MANINNATKVNTNNRLMVYVRVRPLTNNNNTNELDRRSIIDVVDETTLIFDPADCDSDMRENEYYYHGKKYKQIGSRAKKNATFTFDQVFNTNATNYFIYETVTKPMVSATIDGLNCSVFAYGATGSGKTHTMLGSPAHPGVIYYTSRELFTQISHLNNTDPMPAELKICYFEIYNETVRDLLVPTNTSNGNQTQFNNGSKQQSITRTDTFIKRGTKRLRTATPEKKFSSDTYQQNLQNAARARGQQLNVCETSNGDGDLSIPNLSFHQPSSAEELIKLLEFGNRNRSQHPTDANADSSRSHAIFQIILKRQIVETVSNSNCVSSSVQVKNCNSQQMSIQLSKMSLIDLAGSERATVAYRAGIDRSKNLQREGGNINKSLLALGNCINALADSKNHNHIPYRNSKLTRLLRDSLGGNCKTAMIATICQQPSHYDDTQNTLMYATRAKCIKLRPDRNLKAVGIQPKNYTVIIDNLTKGNAQLMSESEKLKSENDQLKSKTDHLKSENEKLNKELSNLRYLQINRTNHQSAIIKSENKEITEHQENVNYIDANLLLQKSGFKNRLDELLDERRSIRLELLRTESHVKRNQLRLVFKKLDEMRVKCLSQLDNNNKSSTNTSNEQHHLQSNKFKSENMDRTVLILPSLKNALDTFTSESKGSTTFTVNEHDENQASSQVEHSQNLQSLKSQIDYYNQCVRELVDAANKNESHIKSILEQIRVEFETKFSSMSWRLNGQHAVTREKSDDLLDLYLTERYNTLELEEKKLCEQHAYDLAQDAIDRVMASENVLLESADLIRYTHRVLQGRGGISDTLEKRFHQLYKRIEGKKSVVWKDDKYDQDHEQQREPFAQLLSVHDNFSLSTLTPFKSHNTLLSRRLSRNLTTLTNYTPEQSNATFDASSSSSSNSLLSSSMMHISSTSPTADGNCILTPHSPSSLSLSPSSSSSSSQSPPSTSSIHNHHSSATHTNIHVVRPQQSAFAGYSHKYYL